MKKDVYFCICLAAGQSLNQFVKLTMIIIITNKKKPAKQKK